MTHPTEVRHVVLAALLVLLLPGILAAQAEYDPPEPMPSMEHYPNIVLITGDHLRWDNIAANGNPVMITPNMDRLVREGTTFRMCFTVGVACTPNRASLMTGRYPNAHGLISNGIKLPENEITLTHVLRGAGYYTGQMGKLHFWPHKDRNHREPHPPYGFHQMRLSDEPGPYDDAYGRWLWAQGEDVREKARVAMPGERGRFDYYTFEGENRTTHASWVATETVTFIRDSLERHPTRPFFVHAGFYAPHPPLNPPASALDRYAGRKLAPRIFRENEHLDLPPTLAGTMPALLNTPEKTWTEFRRHFYAMVTHLDDNIGRIMQAVEDTGIRDRTIFVVTSDHGDYLGDHNITGKSSRPYDGAMRIPLIFRGPSAQRGRASDELVEIIDVMPTLLDMAGLDTPAGNQGISLRTAMGGAPTRDVIYMQSTENQILRSKHAKYAVYGDGSEVLFDLRNDPNELKNVAQQAESKTLLDEMRLRLMRKVIAARDPLPQRIRPY